MPEQTQSQPQPNSKKNIPFPLIVLLVCVAVVVAAYAYQKYSFMSEPTTVKTPSEEPAQGNEDSGTCKNLCGNGVCEEIVCMAIGCPCAETPATCPQDCK